MTHTKRDSLAVLWTDVQQTAAVEGKSGSENSEIGVQQTAPTDTAEEKAESSGKISGHRARQCDVELVKREYSKLMRGSVRRVFRAAYRGELYRTPVLRLQRAAEKLPTLERAIREAMVEDGAVSSKLSARWQLYNSNLFPGKAGAHSRCENSPVVMTLNCAPVDDGSHCCRNGHGPLWTPDYLTNIVTVLKDDGYFPPSVVPLCLEYRSVCPLCVALTVHDNVSLDDINSQGRGPSSFLGWHCGSYGEQHTTSEDRALFGAFASVVHGSATMSWVHVAHAKSIATLARLDHNATDPRVGLGVPMTSLLDPWDPASAWVGSMGHDGDKAEGTETSGPTHSMHHALGSIIDQTDLNLPLSVDVDLTREPRLRRLRLVLNAVHPGRDIYEHGAQLGRNIRTWAVVGRVLQGMRGKVADYYAAAAVAAVNPDPEPGLSPALAQETLALARQAAREFDTSGKLPELLSRVVTLLTEQGHGHVFANGPHAPIAAAAMCSLARRT